MKEEIQIDWRAIGSGIFRGLWTHGAVMLSATLIGNRFDVMTWGLGIDKIQTIQADEFNGTEEAFKTFVTAHADFYNTRVKEVANATQIDDNPPTLGDSNAD